MKIFEIPWLLPKTEIKFVLTFCWDVLIIFTVLVMIVNTLGFYKISWALMIVYLASLIRIKVIRK